jgi:hypothetical protein
MLSTACEDPIKRDLSGQCRPDSTNGHLNPVWGIWLVYERSEGLKESFLGRSATVSRSQTLLPKAARGSDNGLTIPELHPIDLWPGQGRLSLGVMDLAGPLGVVGLRDAFPTQLCPSSRESLSVHSPPSAHRLRSRSATPPLCQSLSHGASWRPTSRRNLPHPLRWDVPGNGVCGYGSSAGVSCVYWMGGRYGRASPIGTAHSPRGRQTCPRVRRRVVAGCLCVVNYCGHDA